MRNEHRVAVIIPVLDEEASIGKVIDDIPRWVDDIIVVDNGSVDQTGAVAEAHGARVVVEPQRGYGAACLCGMDALNELDIVVFLDGDYSDHPEEMPLLVDPIIQGEVDMMIGSRLRGTRERGALTPQAHFGNWLATSLIRIFWGIKYTDLGPFRAIRYRTLLNLDMADQDYGWTVEMQIKAALHAVASDEAPVSYRRRVGTSKVSGTLRGVVGAGYKILTTIFVAAMTAQPILKTNLLILFTRYPRAGTTKTRLIPALGPEGAADLQRDMTRHTVAVAPPPRQEVDTQVRYTGEERAAFVDWLGPHLLYEAQGDGDLGARMARAIDHGFNQAYGNVVLIGTDCPALDSALTAAAFDALEENDVVIGPAEDGGFYLIGMSMHGAPDDLEAFFAEVEWGTHTVLAETRKRIQDLGLKCHELPPHYDVDRPEDLEQWERARQRNRLSIIVPTWNENARLPALLERLDGMAEEIIVSDGGSTDGTADSARRGGALLVEGPRGRARQMNAGAARATGELLLFLHADTTLPRHAEDWVKRLMAFPQVAVGAFSLRIDGPGLAFRFIERMANLRSRWLAAPYGDQALFVRRETFESLGGFRDLPLGEDYDLVRRARARGAIVTVAPRAKTSVRRWRREGTFRLTLRNVVAFFAFTLGVSPARIAPWYGQGRNRRE